MKEEELGSERTKCTHESRRRQEARAQDRRLTTGCLVPLLQPLGVDKGGVDNAVPS